MTSDSFGAISSDQGSSVTVEIDEGAFADARRLAEATLELFKSLRGHYNNTLNSHLRGKVGELACCSWLERIGIHVTPTFRELDKISSADIVAGARLALRLDVKTWDDRFWEAMGRCIAVEQLPKLRRKADALIWCTTPSKLEPNISVRIRGWSSIEEVEAAPRKLTGPSGGRKVDNYQLGNDDIRPLSELVSALTLP